MVLGQFNEIHCETSSVKLYFNMKTFLDLYCVLSFQTYILNFTSLKFVVDVFWDFLPPLSPFSANRLGDVIP